MPPPPLLPLIPEIQKPGNPEIGIRRIEISGNPEIWQSRNLETTRKLEIDRFREIQKSANPGIGEPGFWVSALFGPFWRLSGPSLGPRWGRPFAPVWGLPGASCPRPKTQKPRNSRFWGFWFSAFLGPLAGLSGRRGFLVFWVWGGGGGLGLRG